MLVSCSILSGGDGIGIGEDNKNTFSEKRIFLLAVYKTASSIVVAMALVAHKHKHTHTKKSARLNCSREEKKFKGKIYKTEDKRKDTQTVFFRSARVSPCPELFVAIDQIDELSAIYLG